MQQRTYSRPNVRDYGTLLDLTAHIDVNFVGAFSSVVMAAMSSPFAGGVSDGTHTSGDGGGVGGVVEVGGRSGGSGASGAAGGAGGKGGLKGAGAKGGGGGGNLPFTGFPVVIMAAVGALFASIGTAIRLKLRREGVDRP